MIVRVPVRNRVALRSGVLGLGESGRNRATGAERRHRDWLKALVLSRTGAAVTGQAGRCGASRRVPWPGPRAGSGSTMSRRGSGSPTISARLDSPRCAGCRPIPTSCRPLTKMGGSRSVSEPLPPARFTPAKFELRRWTRRAGVPDRHDGPLASASQVERPSAHGRPPSTLTIPLLAVVRQRRGAREPRRELLVGVAREEPRRHRPLVVFTGRTLVRVAAFLRVEGVSSHRIEGQTTSQLSPHRGRREGPRLA